VERLELEVEVWGMVDVERGGEGSKGLFDGLVEFEEWVLD
jgi:hypothetical protein